MDNTKDEGWGKYDREVKDSEPIRNQQLRYKSLQAITLR